MEREKSQTKVSKRRINNAVCLHRNKLKLSQFEVSERLGISEKTYQRWESSEETLTDIFKILSVFQVLEFTTTEIIDVLGLPPLTLDEIKVDFPDIEILKSIKENCCNMEDSAIERLIVILMNEHLKRHDRKS